MVVTNSDFGIDTTPVVTTVPYRSVCNVTHTYQSFSHSFHKAWAVFMAVAVPQQPINSTLRVFFFLYVCFCFAISTVFQAFFVSYPGEPMYEKKIETLVDLLDSDVVNGIHPIVSFAQTSLPYPQLVKFLEHKKLQADCNDIRKCVERMITKRDIASIIARFFVTYFARNLWSGDGIQLISSLDEVLMPAGAICLFKKGNLLPDRFNTLMRCYLEPGLLKSSGQNCSIELL